MHTCRGSEAGARGNGAADGQRGVEVLQEVVAEVGRGQAMQGLQVTEMTADFTL